MNAGARGERHSHAGGFTLIEVIGALVVFSLGVLMVIRLTTTLSAQMQYAATLSEAVIRTQERLDSLEALPFASLSLGSSADTIPIQGVDYARTTTISSVTGLLYQIQVVVSRADGGNGPSYTQTSYAAAQW